MKGNNFLWAVKQMNCGNKVTREKGFGNSGCEYLEMDDGFIMYFNENGFYLRSVGLHIEDYLAEDWVLL